LANASPSRLNRFAVAYALDPAGELAPVAPPDRELPATGEAVLYAHLARLVDVTDDEIVAAATRYGPLGPLRAVRVADPARYIYLLNRAILNERHHLDELHRWVASGSVIRIPARLAPLALLIVAFAEADPATSAELGELMDDPAPVIARSEPEQLWARLMRHHFQVAARVDIKPARARRWISKPDALVFVRVSLGRAVQLRPAARLVRSLLASFERDGGLAAIVEPAALGRFAVEVAPYHVAPFFGLSETETLAHWRAAAAELSHWRRAVHDLRTLRTSPTRTRVTPPLEVLRAYAGIRVAGASPAEFDDERALAGELSALLALRLQEIGAWPFPLGDILGTFGRALWSLWQPITTTAPPRRCTWSEGCTSTLPANAHGSRRYCDAHRTMAARDRAARNRARRRVGPPPARSERELRRGA
jgi:hypothetical protein